MNVPTSIKTWQFPSSIISGDKYELISAFFKEDPSIYKKITSVGQTKNQYKQSIFIIQEQSILTKQENISA